MSEPLFTVELATAHLAIFPNGVDTTFREDGSVATAEVDWGDPEHIEAAWHAGYGGDQYRMLIEHEVGHSFVADQLGWPHSWSVWSAAHGTGDKMPMSQWSQRVLEEEHLVVSLQRFVNTGIEDEYARLRHAFRDRLPEVAKAFVATARPWLRMRPSPGGEHASMDREELRWSFH